MPGAYSAVDEHERLAFAFVDVVHPVIGRIRVGEEPSRVRLSSSHGNWAGFVGEIASATRYWPAWPSRERSWEQGVRERSFRHFVPRLVVVPPVQIPLIRTGFHVVPEVELRVGRASDLALGLEEDEGWRCGPYMELTEVVATCRGGRPAARSTGLHEAPKRLHHPARRLLRQKEPVALELVDLHVPKRGLPTLQFLPRKRDVLQAPEKERRPVREGGPVRQIERSQSLAPAIQPGRAALAARAEGDGCALQ